jgi:predicted HAD superfamily phosphohydrolase YqeG
MNTEYGKCSKATLESLDVRDIKNATVIIDIDGTVTADGQTECSNGTLQVIRSLASQNTVYLFSNHRDSIRNRAVGRRVGVACIETPHRKPSRKVLASLPTAHRQRRMIVIGDKSVVDGLFAWRIGAHFIKVARVVSPEDRIITKAAYFLDDVISKITDWAPISYAKRVAAGTSSDAIAPTEESRRV